MKWLLEEFKIPIRTAEESFNTGYALEVKWDCKQYKPSKYKKFIKNYPDFKLNCIDSKNLEILKY